MKIKFLKGVHHDEDIYMKENKESELIFISKNYFFTMANDEGLPLFGHYQNINMTPKEYKSFYEFAANQDREKGLTLLNLIHSKNPNLSNSQIYFQGEIPDYLKVTKEQLLENFKNAKPILNQHLQNI